MLKITELRVGNYLYFDQNILVVVTGIYKHKIKVSTIVDGKPQVPSKDWTCFIEGFKGIPLTKDRLLNLGFIPDRGILFEVPIHIQEKCKEDNGFKKSALFFNNRIDINSWMDCQTRVCVKYVHKVQNLVYALSGEEL